MPPTLRQLVRDRSDCRCEYCQPSQGAEFERDRSAHGTRGRLFDPRRQSWKRHFEWFGAVLIGRTQTGRATIAVLAINDPHRAELRQIIMDDGDWPEVDSSTLDSALADGGATVLAGIVARVKAIPAPDGSAFVRELDQIQIATAIGGASPVDDSPTNRGYRRRRPRTISHADAAKVRIRTGQPRS